MLPDLLLLHHIPRSLCIRYIKPLVWGGGGVEVSYFVTVHTMPRMLTYPQKPSHIIPDHMATTVCACISNSLTRGYDIASNILTPIDSLTPWPLHQPSTAISEHTTCWLHSYCIRIGAYFIPQPTEKCIFHKGASKSMHAIKIKHIHTML